MEDQPYLFPEFARRAKMLQTILKEQAMDISKINIHFDGESEMHIKSNRKVKQLQSLEEKRFYAFKGDEENPMPYIKNIKTGKVLKIAYTRDKYPCITLGHRDTLTTTPVHRLLAMCFIENPDPSKLMEVDHLNGNKRDWRLENLEWVSSSENNKRRKILKKQQEDSQTPPNYHI